MKLMQLIYPNLRAESHGQMMTAVFWLFFSTVAILLASILAIQSHMISVAIAKIIEQGIGPVLSLNIALLFFLADQDFKAAHAE